MMQTFAVFTGINQTTYYTDSCCLLWTIIYFPWSLV